jgi:putative tryptophan/tyrosine transport system substrate-binding protein
VSGVPGELFARHANLVAAMRRRDFLIRFGLAALAWPLAARPAAGMPRVAALFNGPEDVEKANLAMLVRGLEEHGYAVDRNIGLDVRYGHGSVDKLPGIVRELIARKPDVVLLQGSQAIWAGKKATSTIPIIMVSIADPVGQGLVASLGRPGENITGLSIVTEADVSKRLQLLSEILPRGARVAYLTNLSNPAMPPIWRSVSDAARQMNLALSLYDCKNAVELDAALAALSKQRPDGVVVEADALLSTSRRKIIAFFLREKLPSMWASPFGAPEGGLMSYGANFTENWRSAARFIDRILKGAKPGDLPVEQPTRVQLLINQKTAQALGITIPPTMLLRADQLIE